MKVKGRLQPVGTGGSSGSRRDPGRPAEPAHRPHRRDAAAADHPDRAAAPAAGAAMLRRGRRDRQDTPARRAARDGGRPRHVAGGRLPLVRHGVALRALHRDAAQVDRRRGGRSRPGSPDEAPREARALLPASQIPDVLPYLARLLWIKLDRDEDDSLAALAPEELAARHPARLRTWMARSPRRARSSSRSRTSTGPTRPRASSPTMSSSWPTARRCCSSATSRIDPESEGWKIRARGLDGLPAPRGRAAARPAETTRRSSCSTRGPRAASSTRPSST